MSVDRRIITKLNLARLEGEGFDYIMGVKHRQDQICSMLLSEQVDEEDHQLYKGLKKREKTVTGQRIFNMEMPKDNQRTKTRFGR